MLSCDNQRIQIKQELRRIGKVSLHTSQQIKMKRSLLGLFMDNFLYMPFVVVAVAAVVVGI